MNPMMLMAMLGLDKSQGAQQEPQSTNAPDGLGPFWPNSSSIQIPNGAKVWTGLDNMDTNAIAGNNFAGTDYRGEMAMADNNGRDAGQGMSGQVPSFPPPGVSGALADMQAPDQPLWPGRPQGIPIPPNELAARQSGNMS